MPVRDVIEDGVVPVRVYTDDVDEQAYRQLRQMAQLPIVFHHIAVMPDVHAGIGATVGAVIPTKAAIVPAAVGVDIGCGMYALQLSLRADQLPDNLRPVRQAIEAAVPVGFGSHFEPVIDKKLYEGLNDELQSIFARHPDLAAMQRRPHRTWAEQIGSLGGGNHFIELCIDEQQSVWIMLHSGSRGIGNAIGRYFIDLARRDMSRQETRLPNRDLAYFTEGTVFFDDYYDAVRWAQNYAARNRKTMMRLIIDATSKCLPPFRITKNAINCHHNYVDLELHFGEQVYVTRKGAIRARKGEYGIIPGSMGSRSYIVKGKGVAESFTSCAHGAGRRMSRTQARKRFTRSDLAKQTIGVECRKDKAVLDEIPAAYKDIDTVMANQSDLVETVHVLKQVLCVKG